MKKKIWLIAIVTFILGLIIGGGCVYFYTQEEVQATPNENTQTENNEQEENANSLNLPTEGNDTVLTTNSDTTLRVINEYDDAFFTKKKNLLMWEY